VARKAKSKSSENEAPRVVQGVYWTPNDAAWGGFINIRLEDEQKLLFNEWYEAHPDEGTKILDDVMGEGAKLGLSYDRENECYVSTLMGALVDNSNERYCVTTRAGTLAEVVALTAWKHAYYAQGDYGSYRPATGKLNNWG